MKKFLSLFTILFICSCATTMPDRITKIGPIDVAQRTIIVQPFEFNPSIAQQVDRNFIKEFGKEIALDISEGFMKEGKDSKVAHLGDNPGDHIGIRGTITMVDGGSMHLRMWFGFGYGASMASARGEIIELKSSRTLMTFHLTKKSNFTWSNSEAAVRENIHEIAQEIVYNILQKEPKPIGTSQSSP